MKEWEYNNLVGLRGLIRAYEHGCKNKHEIAKYLEVTEAFLDDAVNCYTKKYNLCAVVDNYIIQFIPHLIIGKIIL